MTTLLQTAKKLGVDFDFNQRREILETYGSKCDFEVGNYRFISAGDIDEIMVEELSNDEYVLGCFNASFLARFLDIDEAAVKAIQDAEAFEALGKIVLSNADMKELAQNYASADGYGHHFAHYDHETHEIKLGDEDFYFFRTN